MPNCPTVSCVSIFRTISFKQSSAQRSCSHGCKKQRCACKCHVGPFFSLRRHINANLPVPESFGFTGHLRQLTSGQAFPQCVFDHWEQVVGNPFEEGSKCLEIVTQIRVRKGMAPEIPPLDRYLDKL